jgi:dihydrofolate synthase/folylpolyglutamate synthase
VIDVDGAHGSYHDLNLALHGRHQTLNFAIAVAAVEALLGRQLSEEAVREAAAATTSPGRMEIARHHPVIMLDSAHNPAGAEALGAALADEFPTTRWRLVLGAMRDKDLGGILAPLRGMVSAVEAAAVELDRALPAAEVVAAAIECLDVPARAHPGVAEAVAAAEASGEPVLVTGSVYVVGEARRALDLT